MAALRLFIQKSVLRRGIDPAALRQLRTVYLAEALFTQADKNPVDVIRLADVLLGASVLTLLGRGIRLSVSLSGGGVRLVNRKCLTALLLSLAAAAQNPARIRLDAQKNRLLIQTDGIPEPDVLQRLLSALGGTLLKERISGKLLLSLPAHETDQVCDPIENEWVYLADRFSAVHVFLGMN